MNERIIQIISRELVEPIDQISEQTTIESIAKDSIDLIGLIAALSSEFNLRVKPEDLAGIKTVGDIVDYIEKHRGQVENSGSLEAY